jgi:uncharacterized protein YegL
VNALLAGVQYSGLTPLATSLAAKVLQPIVYNLAASGQLAKPVLVLTITDGEPTDNPRDLVVQVRRQQQQVQQRLLQLRCIVSVAPHNCIRYVHGYSLDLLCSRSWAATSTIRADLRGKILQECTLTAAAAAAAASAGLR